MGKINFLTFNKMKIDNIGTAMDCIEMPMAYISSKYRTENFYYYVLASYIDRIWPDKIKGKTFVENSNSILKELKIEMEAIRFNETEELLNKIKTSIDSGNPILLLFDYYEMFYEEMHYKRNHIPHGVVLSGYDDERQVFIIQESAHMQFIALYPLQLTYDMVFEILNKSKRLFEKRKYFESLAYSFKYCENNCCSLSFFDHLKKYACKIKNNENSLVNEIRNFDPECMSTPQGMSGFKRRFSTSHKLFFDFVERILKTDDVEIIDRYNVLKNEYLSFYEIFTSKIIRKYLKGDKNGIENVLEYVGRINNLDVELYKVLLDMIEDKAIRTML